jgi:hypothetical protein
MIGKVVVLLENTLLNTTGVRHAVARRQTQQKHRRPARSSLRLRASWAARADKARGIIESGDPDTCDTFAADQI